ncbi:MAG: methylmalonyl Co-A mutase-associated GTPase MeaB, partial [Bacteroidota bacterium]
MRKRLPAAAYIEGILAQDRIRLSQAITLIESRLPRDRILAHEIVQACLKRSPLSYRIGITGVPGVGKSTFIDRFGQILIEAGHKVAVLAVDPSSEKNKGSILGDKTRMQVLSHHPSAYVRPSPTAGTLGGVAAHTREAMILCEAAGFDVVLVETVGVGQSEMAVHNMVDFFLML